MERYRTLIVDLTDEWYTIVIQVKKWYGWVTFKTIESNQKEVAMNHCNQIMKLLETDL